MSEAVRHLADYDTERRYRATLVSSERITPADSDEEVRELVVEVERPDTPLRIGSRADGCDDAKPGFHPGHRGDI